MDGIEIPTQLPSEKNSTPPGVASQMRLPIITNASLYATYNKNKKSTQFDKVAMTTLARTSMKSYIYFHGHKFYFKYKRSKKNPHLQTLKESEVIDQYSFIIAMDKLCFDKNNKPIMKNGKQKISKMYAIFATYIDFYNWELKVPKEDCVFYEVIRGEMKQKPKFDVDVKPSDSINMEVDGNIIKRLLLQAINDVLASKGITTAGKDYYPIVYNSHKQGVKFSIHIIVEGVHHDNNEEAKLFYDEVRMLLPEKYRRTLDGAVYSSFQCFRLPGSQKIGSGRPKILDPASVLPPIETDDANIRSLSIFENSLVSVFTRDTVHVPVNINETKVIKRFNPQDISDVIRASAIEVFNSHEMSDQFEIKGITPSGSIELVRIKSGHCTYHDKIHDGNGAYLNVNNNRVYFLCLADPRVSRYIGKIGYTFEDFDPDDFDSDDEVVASDDEGVFTFGDYNPVNANIPVINNRVQAQPIINGVIPTEEILINSSQSVGDVNKSLDVATFQQPLDINNVATSLDLQPSHSTVVQNNFPIITDQFNTLTQEVNNNTHIVPPEILINPSQLVGQNNFPIITDQFNTLTQEVNNNTHIVAPDFLINPSQSVGQNFFPTTTKQIIPSSQATQKSLDVATFQQPLDIKNVATSTEKRFTPATSDDLTSFIRTYISKCANGKISMDDVDDYYKRFLIQNAKQYQYKNKDSINRDIYRLLQVKPLRKQIRGKPNQYFLEGFVLMPVANPNTAVPHGVIPPAMTLPQNQTTGCFSKPVQSIAEQYLGKWNKSFIPKLRGNHQVDHSETLRAISQIVGNLNRYALIMKAVCGTGKTVNIVREILQNPNAKILVVCGKRTLGRKQLDDFRDMNFDYYIDKGKGFLRNIPRLIVQIDSLWKVRECDYDYLILDEFTYTQDQLVTFTKKKKECIDALVEWIRDTPKVIVADAFIGENTVDFVRNLRPDLHIYENDFAKQSNKTVFVFDQEGTLFRYIYKAVNQKNKIIIPCGSKDDVKALEKELRLTYPKLVIKSYTSDTIINVDPVNEWADADIVIFTSVCEAGNSFTLEHFDKCFGKFTALSFTPESAAQMLFRSRQLKDNEIYIYVNNRRKPEFPEEIKNIQQMKTFLQRKDIFAREELFGEITVSYRQNTLDVTHPYFHMVADVKLRKHLGMMNFEGRLLNLLKSQGVRFGGVIDQEEKMKKYENQLVSEHRNTKAINKFHEHDDIAESEIINHDRAVEIADNERASIKEKNSLKKYNLMTRYQLSTISASFVEGTINRTFQHRNITACAELSKVCDEKEKIQIMTEIQNKFFHGENDGDVIHVTDRIINTDRMMNYKQCMYLIEILRTLGMQEFIKGGFITRQQFQQSYTAVEHYYPLLRVDNFTNIIELYDKLLGIEVVNLDHLRKKKSPILDVNDINNPIMNINNLYKVECYWKKAPDRNLYIPSYMYGCEIKPLDRPIPPNKELKFVNESNPRIWNGKEYVESDDIILSEEKISDVIIVSDKILSRNKIPTVPPKVHPVINNKIGNVSQPYLRENEQSSFSASARHDFVHTHPIGVACVNNKVHTPPIGRTCVNNIKVPLPAATTTKVPQVIV